MVSKKPRSAKQIAAQKKAAAASATKRKKGKLTQALAKKRAKVGSTRRLAVRYKRDQDARDEGYSSKTLNDFMRREGGATYRNPKLHKRTGEGSPPRADVIRKSTGVRGGAKLTVFRGSKVKKGK